MRLLKHALCGLFVGFFSMMSVTSANDYWRFAFAFALIAGLFIDRAFLSRRIRLLERKS